MTKKHDDFWRNEATSEDYADTNIPLKAQVDYLVEALKPAVFMDKVPLVTEFGCGYGRLTREIQRAFPKALVTGIDINSDIIEKAKARDKDSVYGVANTLKGRPEQSAVYCVQVLQHMPNDRKRQFFQEAASVLRRAGVLVFQYVEGASNTFLTHDAEFKDVSEWLTDAGFEVASVEHNLIQDRWTWVTAVKG